MSKIALSLNVAALIGFVWLTRLVSLSGTRMPEASDHDVYAVNASSHFGALFLIPILLLGTGIALQTIALFRSAQ